jgi:FkbM family methyltransferase
MSVLAKAGAWTKSIGFVMNNPRLRKLLRRVGVFVSWKLHKKGIIKNIGGVGNFLMSPDFTFYKFEEWGSRKNNFFRKLIELAREKKVVFDIGTHIGICTLPISRVIKKGGLCYSFEPAEANRRYLETHLKINNVGNVIVIPYLVGDKCGDCVEFYESSSDSGMNSLCQPEDKGSIYNKVVKEQIILDSFVAKNGCIPELIKIDVEGAEIGVLRGAKDVLKKYHPEIILSIHPKHIKRLGHTVSELTVLIHKFDYQIYNVDGSLVNGELESKEYYLK